MNPALKKHLFFDLDDTLWDFEKNSQIVIRELFDEFVLETKLNTDIDSFLAAYKTINLGLWSKYYKKEINKQYLRNHRFNLAFQHFGYDNYNENLLVTEQYLARAPKGSFLKEGCVEVLNYLQQKGYGLHIITNGFKEVVDIKMDTSGLRSYFSHIIISEEHELTKPDEKIFRLAERYANTEAWHCVMIGDSFESDIVGAKKAGWEAIYFTANNPEDFKGRVINKLEELRAIF